MWIQIECELLTHSRFLALPLPVRHYYIAMIAEAMETESETLSRQAWESTRVMRVKVGLGPEEYPNLTAEEALQQLAGPAAHLIDLTPDTVTIRGFMKRYGPLFEKKAKDVARKREARSKSVRSRSARQAPEDLSRGRHSDEAGTSQDPGEDVQKMSSGCPSDVQRTARGRRRVDRDVDSEGDPTGSPPPDRHPLTPDGPSPEPQPTPAPTARTAHMAPLNGNDNGLPTKLDWTPVSATDLDILPATKPEEVVKRPPPVPMTRQTAATLNGWINDAGGAFRRSDQLRCLVQFRDHDDPVTTLAHMLELAETDAAGGSSGRLAILHRRMLDATITPAERYIDAARAELNADDPGGGDGGKRKRGGVPVSPTQALQSALTQRKSRDVLAELGPETAAAIDDLVGTWTESWGPPPSNGRAKTLHPFRVLLAGDPLRALAYVEQVKRSISDGDRWAELARLSKVLADPHPECSEVALAAVRNLVGVGKSVAKTGTG